MTKRYTASLSQTQGRAGYTVIFRHPVRRDEATGRPGVRVRKGLGTRDLAEAERLRDQLNELLGDTLFHDAAARPEAERRFDQRVVDIFFDKMVPEEVDFVRIRDEAVALPPSSPDGYRRVLLLGTTGAGKTTVVRQLIGTDPATERFPSTSTAKTTIHDTEIIVDDGPWRAVVTFAASDEIREYLNECISAAVLAASKGADDATILRRLLNHVNQRYRFSYVLGTGPSVKSVAFGLDDEDEDDQGDDELFTAEDLGDIDVDVTEELLQRVVSQLRSVSHRLGERLRDELVAADEGDERVLEELFEEELDNLLRDDDEFHAVADALMDEIEKRFELLPQGTVKKTKQGWPLSWHAEWDTHARRDFLKAITRFSSNYAPYYGRLLTPLVNGVRVSGPFTPTWLEGQSPPKLVILDGEGLGHTPTSASSVSTGVSRRIELVDAVLLIDNATQPMQAAPVAAMREVISTGNARKLIVAFTHFDEVKGDNLPNAEAKAQHVLASAENVLAAFGEELGAHAERAVRKRLDAARFFLGGLHEPLATNTAAGRRTVKQLRGLLQAIEDVVDRPQPASAQPVYDRMDLVLGIRSAAEAFQHAWRQRLGLESGVAMTKEHWTRVKALSRRLATGMADEYDTLKPVADLRRELTQKIYVFVQNPLEWEGPEPTEDEEQATYDAIAENIASRLMELSTRRVWRDRANEWRDAYDKHGTGSTFVRARIIGDDIYEPAAPVPDVVPSPDRNLFLREVVAEVEAAAREVGARLR